MTATSVVPPPMSTIMLPVGSVIGRPAPIAAAIACSTMKTSLAPAWSAESFTARFSTCVMSEGTEMTIFGPHEERAAVRLLDEVVEHPLGDLEVGDDAVLHGADRDDVAGRAAEHLLGGAADGLHLVRDLVHGHDGRLAHDDSAALGEHERVRGPEVDREVGGEDREEGTKSQDGVLSRVRRPERPPPPVNCC